MPRNPQRPSNRQYPRTARLNVLLREILADELERTDDERLELVTVTGVDIEADLSKAVVFFSSLSDGEDDDLVLEAFDERRAALQRAIGAQARMKRVPLLSFKADPAIRTGARIDAILHDLHASGGLPEDTPAADEVVGIEVDADVDGAAASDDLPAADGAIAPDGAPAIEA